MIELVEIGADGSPPPLLAVPGIDGSIGSVEPIVRRLSDDRRVVVADYTREDDETLDGLAGSIADVARDRLSPPIDLLGQSIGTIAAARIAHTHLTEGVRRTVLLCTFTELTDWRLRVGRAFMRLTPDWLHRKVAPLAMAYVCGPVGDGRDHPFLEAASSSDREAVARRTGWQIGRDFSDDLEKVPGPMLVLMGEEDRFVPDAREEIRALRRLLADRPARVVAVPDGGHVFLDSRAIRTATSEIGAFLAGEPG